LWNKQAAQGTEPTLQASQADDKQKRKLQTKLKEIEALKEKQAAGQKLDPNQEKKIGTEAAVRAELEKLG